MIRRIRGEQNGDASKIGRCGWMSQSDVRYHVFQLFRHFFKAFPVQIGQGESGSDAVHGDAVRPEFSGHAPYHVRGGGFGHGIHASVLLDDERKKRGRTDDFAKTLFFHDTGAVQRAEERSAQVDIHEIVVVFRSHVPQRLATCYRRIAEQYVDAAELGTYFIEYLFETGDILEVSRLAER